MSKDIGFCHVRTLVANPKTNEWVVANRGGFTVAYVLSGNVVTYAIAQCSKRDQFCKLVGRTVATDRLMSGNSITLMIPDHYRGVSVKRMFEEMFSVLL
jgi:hypothetical protein